MQLFESIFEKISQDDHWIQKIIIGGLISFIPIVNLLALGYLYRFALNARMHKVVLPRWNEWRHMVVEGIRFLVLIFIYALAPIFLGWLLTEALRSLTLNMVGVFAYIPFSVMLIIATGLTMVALYSFSEEPTVEALLNVKRYCRMYSQCWKRLLVPTFVFFGIVSVGLPLFGVSFFIALIGLIAYSFSVLSSISLKEGKSHADV